MVGNRRFSPDRDEPMSTDYGCNVLQVLERGMINAHKFADLYNPSFRPLWTTKDGILLLSSCGFSSTLR